MSQKDDDFTHQQRAKTKAGVPPLCCPQSLNAQASLKLDRGTRLVFSSCFVVYTVNFPENLTGTNFAVLSVRRESTEENAAGSDSDLSLFKD